ncbi:MAG: hypothetical protein RI962_1064 [Pseudomonadota bacterium]|jgi:hypothetical protein
MAFRMLARNPCIKVPPALRFHFNNLLHYEIMYRILKNQ